MKPFLNACGLKDALRLVVAGPGAGEGEPWSLPQPFAVIGRDPRADVILDHPKVSRRHVYLQVVAGQAFWIDLESRTGTRTESGSRKTGWLPAAGSLKVGPFVIRRPAGPVAADPGLGESTRESPLESRGYGREALPEVALEFLNGPAQSTRWPMRRVMSLIGSADGCKFRLTDPSVSAFHAGLVRTAAGLWIVDLRGARSITINGEPVRYGHLADGDVLGVGRYRIRVRCQEFRAGAAEPSREVAPGLPARRDGGGVVAVRPSPGPASGPPALGPPPPMPPPPFPVVASTSGVEIMSADLVAHGRFAGDAGESVLVPLVNQFSMMQQQMFDQFQQAMGMLVQMFGTMHREQMDVIREELDRLHELSRELLELKNELSRSPVRPSPSPDMAAAAPVAPAPAPASSPPADRRPSATPTIPFTATGTPPGGDRSIPVRGSSAEVPIPATGTAAAGPGWPIGPATAPPPPPTPRPDQPRPGVGSPGAIGPQGAPGPEQDAVAWIHQRIMTLQRERETRWQKILKLLPGVS